MTVQYPAPTPTQSDTPQEPVGESIADFQRAEPTKPGAPPVISASVVQEKWLEAQRLIFSNTHKATGNTGELVVNLPNLMDHAHVLSVDGNTVMIGVEQSLYLEKLNDRTRLAWVERAISRVTDMPLRVRYVLANESEPRTPAPDMQDDPLIQDVIGLGGQIREDDE